MSTASSDISDDGVCLLRDEIQLYAVLCKIIKSHRGKYELEWSGEIRTSDLFDIGVQLNGGKLIVYDASAKGVIH